MHYYNKEFSGTREKFASVLENFPDDTVADFYSHRCIILEKDPPGEDWLGIENISSK